MTSSRPLGAAAGQNPHACQSDVATDRATSAAPSLTLPTNLTPEAVQQWFVDHVTLSGQPYTLDLDQARAVADAHKNTLVTARAGSGKTRVIVAKIAYLVATRQARLAEIAVFMFNRTAAAEVNERIGEVAIDGRPLPEVDLSNTTESPSSTDVPSINVASTFHKFALDLVKLAGLQPSIISESEHDRLVQQAFFEAIRETHLHIPPRERADSLKLVSSFIARAGQQYIGPTGVQRLSDDVEAYCSQHLRDVGFQVPLRTHRIALVAYQKYLSYLRSPKIDFNLLMSLAADLLMHASDSDIEQARARHAERRDASNPPTAPSSNLPFLSKVAPLRYLLVDEYQDFSYLFYSIIQAIRHICPDARLFAVGDDWQAINRFAGSDVDYFINFAKYFPEDHINIPLMTNYRSARQIVENANDYMLAHYEPSAARAVPFSRQRGKIFRLNPSRIRFDATDIYEDGLGDGRYQFALARHIAGRSHADQLLPIAERATLPTAARLLKSVAKILSQHPHEQTMLLHRHNFTSIPGVTLPVFVAALRDVVTEEGIMTDAEFSSQVRCMTMHKSKGLEAPIVVLLELEEEIVLSSHPHSRMFEIFGDSAAAEKADQHRLLYVALTRAKSQLYIISRDKKSPA